jgi:D-alanyl-D-alanine carboxypeptidase (penicillin-binding protein 5/6)
MIMKSNASVINRFMSILLIFAAMTVCFAAMFCAGSTVSSADGGVPSIDAISALVIDARRGQIILSKGADEQIKTPVANRIMTALIALEKVEPSAVVTASKEARDVDGAKLDLAVGEKYSVNSLIYALILTGANDAAKAIAEYVGGGEAGFVSRMNEYASVIGMKNTRFTNSTGLYDENQYTTVSDIALLLKYALDNSAEFGKIFATQAKPWYDATKTILLTNSNSMFWDYEGTDGGIIGGFDDGLLTAVTTVTRSSMRLICVLSGSAEKIYADTAALFNYSFDNFRYGTLVVAGSVQKTVTIEGETVNLVPSADVHYIYPRGQNYIKNIKFNIDDKIKPPITKKTVMGVMSFTLLDGTVINIDLYADREILPKKTDAQILKERLNENKELIYVIIGLLVLEAIMLAVKAAGLIRKLRIARKAGRHRIR